MKILVTKRENNELIDAYRIILAKDGSIMAVWDLEGNLWGLHDIYLTFINEATNEAVWSSKIKFKRKEPDDEDEHN